MAGNPTTVAPDGRLYIARSDFDYWTNDAVAPVPGPARKDFLGPAQKNLLPNRDRMHFFKDGKEFLPGITALAPPGHTVGHTIFMIQLGGQQLCYIGDLAHHPVLLLKSRRAQFAFDTDPVQSAESSALLSGLKKRLRWQLTRTCASAPES